MRRDERANLASSLKAKALAWNAVRFLRQPFEFERLSYRYA